MSLEERVREQAEKVRKMKAEKAPKDQLDDEIAKLKALKAELGSSGPNLAADKKLSGSKEGQKSSAALVQDPRVKEQGDLVRRLKSSKAPKEEIAEAVAKLKELKAQFGDLVRRLKSSKAPKEEIAE